MSANIDTMFSGRGEMPWHKLGTIVQGTPESADALRLAGLDWDVIKRPVFARIPNPCSCPVGSTVDDKTKHAPDCASAHGMFKRVDSLYATVRSDNQVPLGIVGKRYVPIVNRDCFSLLDGLVKSGAAQYETAGSLGVGEQVWMLMVTPEELKVAGDLIRPYFLATTSHDGSGVLYVRNVATRVVCANTLAMAMGEKVSHELRIRHTAGAQTQIDDAAEILGLMQQTTAAFVAESDQLLATTFSKAEFLELAKALVPAPDRSDPTTTDRQVRSWERRFEALVVESYGQRDLDNVRGTAWGALNTIADYEQHYVRTKGTDEQRLETLFRRSFMPGEGSLVAKARELISAKS